MVSAMAAFTYQLSDLDTFVSEAHYGFTEIDDIEEIAEQLEFRLLADEPSLGDSGLVLVIADTGGSPLHMRPLGRIH